MQQVAQALGIVRGSAPVDCRDVHSRFVDRRGRLNAHVARMHSVREPTGKSVFEMQGAILRLSHSVNTSTRWRGSDLAKLVPPVDQKVGDLFTDAAGLASLFLRSDPSPWTGAVLPDGLAVDDLQPVYTHALSDMSRIRTGCFHPDHHTLRGMVLPQFSNLRVGYEPPKIVANKTRIRTAVFSG
jgi:hypothetical protein